MKICQDCFNDIELKAIVGSDKLIDTCDICGKKNYIYDTENNTTLVDVIDDFMNIYKLADDKVPHNKKFNLENELINHWAIFSKNCVYKVKSIIKSIYGSSPDKFDISLFDNEVYIPALLDDTYLNTQTILKNHSWVEFTNEVKFENRYHSRILNEDKLDLFLDALIREIPANSIYFRARISDEVGFKDKEMGMPPPNKSRSGRISVYGIPCFYLTNNCDTAIKEVRAGAFDYVTIARYKLKESIHIIDLRMLDSISPFSLTDILSLVINNDTLQRIKAEIEKPVRVTENNIEYIPIQYICDYIRSKGYDGIIYNSTMSAKGYNLSTFSDEKFKYMGRNIYYINDLSVDYTKMK